MNMSMKSSVLLASALGTMLGLAGPAWSQQASDARAEATASDVIVVTARKREEKLIDVPVAVTALGRSTMELADISNPVELSAFTPGLDFQQAAQGTDGGGSNPNITFRGIRQQLSSQANQVGAIFWDGSFMGAGSGILPIEDLQRVEVIKGPQTAYFGRNTFAGAINYIPQAAGDEFSVNGELLYSPSDQDSFKVAVAGSIPMGPRANLRLNFVRSRQGADFTFRDGTPLNQQDKTAFGGVLTLEPVDDLNLRFSGYYADAKDTFLNISIDSTVPAGQCNRVFTGEYINPASGVRTPFTRDFSKLTYGTFCGAFPRGTNANMITPQAQVPTAANTVGGDTRGSTQGNALLAGYGFLPDMPDGFGGHHRTWRAQMNGDYTIGEHMLSWIASHSKFGSSYSFDQNFGLATSPLLLPRGFQTWIAETYLEGRISSPRDKRLRYMVGTTYFKSLYRNGGTGSVLNINFENSKSLSFFGALDFDITDTLTISGEGRYTDDELYVLLNGNPTLPTNNSSVTFQQRNGFKKFMPRVILSYQPTDRTNIYASWSKSALIGEQTNAAVVSALDPQLIPDPRAVGDFTPPQQNTSYELGWKQQFDNASFSVALFHMRWKNQVFRTTVLAGVQTTTYAAPGESKYTGVEFEGTYRPTSWLDLGGGLVYVDPKLVSYASRSSFEFSVLGSGSLSVVSDGYMPKGVSRWSGNFNATVRGDIADRAAYARVDVLYRGGFYAENLEFNRIAGAVRLNARAGIEAVDGITVEVYGKNLTDVRQLDPISFTTTGVGANRKIFAPPTIAREIGVRALFNF